MENIVHLRIWKNIENKPVTCCKLVSLVRKLFFENLGLEPDKYVEELGETLGEALLNPTKIYAKACGAVKYLSVKGIVHVTGGGFYENVPRILPEDMAAAFDVSSWEAPPIFDYIQKSGDIEESEMFSTFNMGIGMTSKIGRASCRERV